MARVKTSKVMKRTIKGVQTLKILGFKLISPRIIYTKVTEVLFVPNFRMIA